MSGKISTLCFVTLLILSSTLPCLAKYSGGTGIPGDPYLIATPNDLNSVGLDANDWDKHFKMIADIDLSGFTGNQFNLIGYWDSGDNSPFMGVFDGNGHTISNFTYEASYSDVAGLFGYVTGEDARIENLSLFDPNISAGTGGLLVGYLEEGTVSHCNIEGGTFSGEFECGGLVGINYYSTISECSVNAIVRGEYDNVGGLVGYNIGGNIYRSCSSGTVESSESRIGGLVGWDEDGAIQACYSLSDVNGGYGVGGLIGRSDDGEILDCYVAGYVQGTGTGGLIGYNDNAIIIDSFWDVQATGQSTMCGGGYSSCDDSKGRTTAKMQKATTFALWACEPNWAINDGLDYPRLEWQNLPGEALMDIFWPQGSGEPNNPYLIYTGDQLSAIGAMECIYDGHFKMMADIDLSAFTGTEYNVIGYSNEYFSPWFLTDFFSEEDIVPFKGVFDGNGHAIYNFSYDLPSPDVYGTLIHIGIFGLVDDVNAVIKNLGIVEPDIYAEHGLEYSMYCGSLVGGLASGTVTGCWTIGGTIENSGGGGEFGGLVGENTGNIIRCYTANVLLESDGGRFGGLIGRNKIGNVADCYAINNISGSAITAGGLIGDNYKGDVYHSYSAGSVSGNKVGGFAGNDSSGLYTKCFWDSNVCPGINGIGNGSDPNVIGLPTVLMQTESTFTDAGWDFVDETINGPNDIWGIREGLDYPRLAALTIFLNDMNLDHEWMYQNLPWQTSSRLRASIYVYDDPMDNNSYTYSWEFILPDDVNTPPSIIEGGQAGDAFCGFAAPGINDPNGISDSGQPITIRVTVTGDNYGNVGIAEAPFNIILLGDVNKDGVVDLADRSIINAFWRTGSAGPYTLRDCDVTCDGYVDLADYSITNAAWQGMLNEYLSSRYSGGTGEPNDPYLIATPEDLNSIGLYSYDWGMHFKVIADINMSGITGDSFNIIGHWDIPFTGVFDGNNHSISNFIYESELPTQYVGMFGFIENTESVVKDVTLIKPVIQVPSGQVGALVGQLYSGEIINCTVMNGEATSTDHVGGLAGVNRGIISGCHVQVSVFGENWIGGLVGFNRGRISACSANGTITGLLFVGGLVGTNYSSIGEIELSYARTFVLGDTNIGGLVGENDGGIISNCYSLGLAESYGNGGGIGGLVGDNDDGVILSCFSACRVTATDSWIGAFLGMEASDVLNNCFWDSDVNHDVNGIGFGSDPNVIGLPTAEMKMRSTFTDAGWDMINVWDIGEGQTYPFLRTHLPSNINKDDETNFQDFAILAENWFTEE